jgi:cell fate regulator YaaT (PSP1 superfamily)
MACSSCAVAKDGKPGGCNGNCSGGCNRMNTFDWLTELDIYDTANDFDLIEVSFKNGSHKDFFHNPPFTNATTGDWVLVEIPGGGGYDIGKVSLSGDLVRLQMKKKDLKDGSLFLNVIRKANSRDLEKLEEMRASERDTMIKARAIARTLDLDMKIGDVEYQGDGRKATFFYTADGRVDFRELIRHYAKDFKVKIEMRQIGARQESARIGGIGVCGRELCCSTWLSDFKSVSTTAARYQQLAINQAKLSGMCGRLKCCLNYELDSYIDALIEFPENPDRLSTKSGHLTLIKTDVFKGIMVFVFDSGPERGKFYTLGITEVKHVLAMNKRGEQPDDLKELQFVAAAKHSDEDDDGDDDNVEYGGDLVGAIELPDDKRKKKKKKKPFEKDRRFDRPDRKPEGTGNGGGTGNNGNGGGTERRGEFRRDQPQQPPRPQRPQQPRPPQSNNGNEQSGQNPQNPDNRERRDFKDKKQFKDKRNFRDFNNRDNRNGDDKKDTPT